MLASTAPIFAADAGKTVVLSEDQLAKLTDTQTKITNLVTKIDELLVKYKDTKKTHGLLTALKQFKKISTNLNNEITKYKANPTAPADKKISIFQKKESVLESDVAIKEKILIKITTTVTLTDTQLAKLTDTQSKIANLLTKIDGLQTTYKDTKKTHGLLIQLKQVKKQSSNLNTEITKYKANPTAPADKKIKNFQNQELLLEKKVTTIGTKLAKTKIHH
jgi:phage shock protein A